MKRRTVIALAGTCAAAGIAIAVHLALTIPNAPWPAGESLVPAADVVAAEGRAATLTPDPVRTAGANASRSLDLPTGQAPSSLPPARADFQPNSANPPGSSAQPHAPLVSPEEKSRPWRTAGFGKTGERGSDSESSPPGAPGTAPQAQPFLTRFGPLAQGVEVQLREETTSQPGARPIGSPTEEPTSANDPPGPIAVRFYPTGVERGELDLGRTLVSGGPPVRSPLAPDDLTFLRRSLEEFRSLCRPLDHVGTRYYSPRYLTIEQLQVLIEPLVSETGSQCYRAPLERQAGQNAAVASSAALAVRDRLEVLDRLDRVVPLLDTAPAYVSLDAVVLDIRLSGGSGVDFHRLIQKRRLIPAEHTRRKPAAARTSSDAGSLRVAYLDGDINGLLEALGAFGTATLVATPRVAVRQGADAEIELEAGATPMHTTNTPGGQAPGQISLADTPPAPGLRLLVRPLAAYEGGMDMEVRTVLRAPGPEADLATLRGHASRAEDSGTRPGQASLSIVVPDGVTLVIGGLTPSAAAEAPPEKTSFLGIRPFWSRPLGDRHELLVLVTPKVAGTSPAELAKAMDALDGGLRRLVAQKYFRAADRAQLARRDALALQWVEQALRFDGAHPAAVELYERLQNTASATPRTTWR